MGVTKRAGRQKGGAAPVAGSTSEAKPQTRRAVFESKKKEVGVSDLTLISKITNEAINENLKLRFENAEIYTYIGHVLVSVNPFRDLGIYTQAVEQSYEGRNRLEASPHVFAVAEHTYHHMQAYRENQCVIISGESGAGKTEAAKRMMQYVAQRSGGSAASDEIKAKVLATNPLLESFGNAKTLRNNNSSRFGKYLELQFAQQVGRQETEAAQRSKPMSLEPVGANITNYLLEKSRVVGQTKLERNFHIFYQFTKAASRKHQAEFDLLGPESYEYLRRSDCLDVPGIDDVADFQDTLSAMNTIKISSSEQNNIFRMLSTILWIGNVSFAEDDSGNATVADPRVTNCVAKLLEAKPAHVTKALTLRIVETSRGGRRGSVYEVPLNITQATAVRDALAKAIYFNLFDWIVAKLNVSLKAVNAVQNTIGILDIYGFEIFERNSFEQLCINYVNEKLQQIFIQLTLKTEQEEYAREKIQWTPIKYFDNKIVCDLIEERRPPGVFAALNDACATAHADSGAADGTFVQRLNALSSNPHFQPRQGQFVVKHYAGDVNYAIEGMTDKNKDQLLKDILNLMAESHNTLVKALFPHQVNQDDKRRPPTAGDKIKASANDLVATLMKASPSYIRTIKPNENKSPSEYNVGNVVHQIKYLGLQENVRIRRAGFAHRWTFETFFDRFFPLSPYISYGVDIRDDWTGNALAGTKQILKDTSIRVEDFQLGATKVFIKSPETIFALEKLRDRHYVNLIIRIQRAWRNYLAYRIEAASRIQRCWRRAHGGDEYQKMRDYGHQVLQGRKERRRFSLIGSRRYLGDYLGVGVNNGGGFGEIVRNSLNLSGHEQAIFSCRCELLVTKFGRSSKPEPRVLVLTNKAVYLVAFPIVNNVPSVLSERSIPLGAIKYVSISILKDDWFSLGVSSPQQPDPLVNCIFKNEFITHLKRSIPGGSLDLRIGDSIQYNKKPGKPSTVKVVRDPSVRRDDFYKSGTIHTGPGEAADSRSAPTPKSKAKPPKPIIQGKLLRPGGPNGTARKPQARPQPTKTVRIKPAAAQPAPVQTDYLSEAFTQKPMSEATSETQFSTGTRDAQNAVEQPQPPPSLILSPDKPNYLKAVHPFEPQLSAYPDPNFVPIPLVAGETVDVRIDLGDWVKVIKSDGTEGPVPKLYLEKQIVKKPIRSQPPPAPPVVIPRAASPQPVATRTNGHFPAHGMHDTPVFKAKPIPPTPPKRPAVKGRKPPVPPPRDSVLSIGASSGNSGRSTPDTTSGLNKSIAADLAAQLKSKPLNR